jgi:hypothetical protein
VSHTREASVQITGLGFKQNGFLERLEAQMQGPDASRTCISTRDEPVDIAVVVLRWRKNSVRL